MYQQKTLTAKMVLVAKRSQAKENAQVKRRTAPAGDGARTPPISAGRRVPKGPRVYCTAATNRKY